MNSWTIFLLLSGLSIQGFAAYHVVCIYTNWSQYRPDIGKFLPEDVDPSLCTHLIYVYAKLKGNSLVASEWNDEGTTWSEGMYDRVHKLKQLNPELKILLGVGGWMMGSKDFSRLAARPGSRKMFASSAVKFLRDRDFDGLTIDWQYPTRRGGKPFDKTNFPLLLKELRQAFENESKKSSLPTLMLTVGVSASRDIIDSAYEIDNITRYTDFINVMAYDLHGPWDNYTGHPSQLYPRKEEFGPSTDVNVDAVMRYWLSNVPDLSKLVLGTSTYGRSFTLRKERHNEYNVPTKGPGIAGEYTKQPGMLAYYELCSQYPDATRVWDDYSKVAYWYKGDQWMATEDTESLKAKIRWMKRFNTGGISIWSLDTDDFYDTCSGGSYPLLKAIQAEIAAPFVYTTTTWTSTSTTDLSTSTPIDTTLNTSIQRKFTNNPTSVTTGKVSQTSKATQQPKKFRSRNEKPDTEKKTSKKIREGNRIIVRRKNVIKQQKNGKNVPKNGGQKEEAISNSDKAKPDVDSTVKNTKAPLQASKDNSKSKEASSITASKLGGLAEEVADPSKTKKTNNVKTNKPKSEPIKTVKETKQAVKSDSAKGTGEKPKTSQNGGKSQAKPSGNKKQRPGKRRGRKGRRRKLTRKQIEILKRRINKKKQMQRRNQSKGNKQQTNTN